MLLAHRTLNTNIILLGAPHRYDLPSSSCVNTEVQLYNKKLQGLMSTFNHVRVLSMPTERSHHSNHGLHLNKKGNWIVNNLVQVEVICLTEHWLNHATLNSTNIANFKLVSAFCRKSNNYGGSCIYVKENILIRNIDNFASLDDEKNFEVSLIELVDYKLHIVCVYRSLDGQIDIFLNKLENLIRKLTTKKKSLLLCGDWNIDTLNAHRNQKDLANLLQRFNLVNTVIHPTRETTYTSSSIDVMITNRTHYTNLSNIYELGLSDHYAQVLTMIHKNVRNTTVKIWKRRFNEYNISKFSELLRDMTWNEVFQKTEVNAKFEVFMNVISVLFDTAFPPKLKNISKPSKATWVTQGIRISSKNVRFFNMIKKSSVTL